MCRPPRPTRSTWRTCSPRRRRAGAGVGRALINAVGDWAAEHGYGRVYWHTHETNATARLLYDKVATLPGFIMYTMDVPRPTD